MDGPTHIIQIINLTNKGVKRISDYAVKKAMAGKYAIPAYNFNNMEQLQAIVMGCVESKSPFILQVSSGARKYANQTLLRFLAMGAVAMIKDAGSPVKFALHLDHGDTGVHCGQFPECGTDHGRRQSGHRGAAGGDEGALRQRRPEDHQRQSDQYTQDDHGHDFK